MRSIFFKNRVVYALDSSRLPYSEKWLRLTSARQVISAIRKMQIRGAPLIGVAAAYGLALEALRYRGSDAEKLKNRILKAAEELRLARPTGRNLSWAIDRCLRVVGEAGTVRDLRKRLLEEAGRIADEDVETNLRIARNGLELIRDGDRILTHCNTGGLGTVEYGTALGIIRLAWEEGRRISVLATETRPLLQGARLTAWELRKYGVPFKLICDSMAGYVMSRSMVDKVLVGADRVLATGHVANKIGTLTLAVLAKHYGVSFYVAAPLSTFDLATKPQDIPIEERDPSEVTCFLGRLVTVEGVEAINPAFDVTPPELISGIVTEKGILQPPYENSIPKAFSEKDR
ncbi:MAG: S-methyl-5-thioribose-1-phosphate isomerase [Candidatus Brockarchaeota archaeon]|nr:S-methyl-5-thioribose-1-phosphate isomerase [Candidatus Brockarchaeota archaeon]MBO3808558.1 S-methyl-5-thioribose-1-phosphate isomerase [Candidatus Brockarchaeota archaeon]